MSIIWTYSLFESVWIGTMNFYLVSHMKPLHYWKHVLKPPRLIHSTTQWCVLQDTHTHTASLLHFHTGTSGSKSQHFPLDFDTYLAEADTCGKMLNGHINNSGFRNSSVTKTCVALFITLNKNGFISSLLILTWTTTIEGHWWPQSCNA